MTFKGDTIESIYVGLTFTNIRLYSGRLLVVEAGETGEVETSVYEPAPTKQVLKPGVTY